MVPEADDHVRPAGHSGVYGVVSEEEAERRVVRDGGRAPDRVARIDVLETDGYPRFLEVPRDGIAEEHADIAMLDVSRGVAVLAPGHQILARALCDHDHSVAAAPEPLTQCGDEP